MTQFLYGPLRSPLLLRAVAGAGLTTQPARLAGYALTGGIDGGHPALVPDTAATTAGLCVTLPSGAALDRIRAYLALWAVTWTDVEVEVDGQRRPATTFLLTSDHPKDATVWSFDDWAAGREDTAVWTAQDIFARNPLPDAQTLQRLYPMAEKRAWAQKRARANRRAPAILRHQPAPSDVTIEAKAPIAGGFFGLQPSTVRHRTFDGGQTEPLPREVFLGIDAALVLPYDPGRDRLLLVEQMRMGPAMLGDPNPWTLEPVAGMVDAGETPQDAARREAEEEAGLTGLSLIEIAAFYPSPGSSTDYFHAFLGLTDLPQTDSYTGGLATEHEDLRLHVIAFDQAMALARSGEITAGPLLMMLYWLAGERDRLRAAPA